MSSTRLDYREPKKPRAVCVYTIAQESRYVIIENLSAIGIIEEFIRHCGKFGTVQNYRMLDDHPSSTEHLDVCWVQYDEISSARYAKRMMDDKVYCYQRLRVNYAPEYETHDDIRAKFQDRFQAIHKRLNFAHGKRKRDKRDVFGPQEETRQDMYSRVSAAPAAAATTAASVVPKRRRI